MTKDNGGGVLTKTQLLDSIPVRKFAGEMVRYVAFKEIVRMLENYNFTQQELALLKAEIENIKERDFEGSEAEDDEEK